MQREQFRQPTQIKDTFRQPSVSNAQCNLGKEIHLSVGMNCDNQQDKFPQLMMRLSLVLDI